MISDSISVFQWVSIAQETRDKIASMLELKRSGTTQVANGILITDGYTEQDLAGITNDKLERFTHIGDGAIANNLNKLIEIIETREPEEIKIPAEIKKEEPAKEIKKEVKRVKKLGGVKKLVKKLSKKSKK